MGLLARLGRTSPDEPATQQTDVPAAWMAGAAPAGRLLLQNLGENGFSVRDPMTNESLLLDDARLNAIGAQITSLVEIGARRDPARCEASIPGLPLQLVPEGSRVVVLDASGQLDIGYLDDALGRAVATAIEQGAELHAVSLWETRALDGSRTELRVLIVPESVEIIHGIEAPTPVETMFEPPVDELTYG